MMNGIWNRWHTRDKSFDWQKSMIVGTVAQSPIKMGQIAVENMYNILNGKKK